jgi:hypothetical protein
VSGRFDWYQATVEGELLPLFGALEGACQGRPVWEDMEKAPHGYAFGRRLNDMDGQVGMVWWGGVHELPHVVGTSDSAQAVSEVLRAEYSGKHRVTRADACLDFAEAGAYERLQGLALQVASDRRLKVGTAGDHLLTKVGRTLYLGAPTSTTRLRLYDKAAELAAKYRWDPKRRLTVPDELTRLECQVRPHTPEAKLGAAFCSPVELMGSSAWMRDLMQRVSGLQIAPFEAGRPWRQADDDRAYSALLAQYGGMLQRRMEDHGSWEMLGRQMGEDLAERAAVKRRRGR